MKRPLGQISVAFLVLVLATGAVTRAQAQTLTVLHSFTGSPGDGMNPVASLIMDTAGNLYGTTEYGGTGTCIFSSVGCGIVFKVDSSGHETVLHSFTNSGGDGLLPQAALITDTVNNLYGTTFAGGTSDGGSVFKLDSSGNETVLHSFTIIDDGEAPTGALIIDTAGNLYGTTLDGGASNDGVVFKLDSSGNETVLYSFTGGANQTVPGDGGAPFAGLIRDTAGNLYGTTVLGGTGMCPFPGCGTVFKLDSSGHETVLHSFTGSPGDGSGPVVSLIMDTAGNLYGTTVNGGTCSFSSVGCGIVFKLDSFGHETVLHSFTNSGGDGAFPGAALIMDTAGNLYGTTEGGGASSNCSGGCGTVFKLNPSGNETVLHSFSGGDGGANPFAALIMDTAGNLYGTTTLGGTGTCPFGCGTVFKLTVQTPQQATQAIINSVNALFSQLNGGQDNSLVVHLQHAINLMNAGKNAGAIGNLDSFISEVNDLLSSGVLSASQAASLVSAAESVIARLS